jgi:AraC family L-rhamnose operon transcriptional activator RhaR
MMYSVSRNTNNLVDSSILVRGGAKTLSDWEIQLKRSLSEGKFFVVRDPGPSLCETHTHEFIEIEYIISGKGVQIVNGVEYLARKGDVFFFNIGDYHSYYSIHDFEIVNCVFYPDFVDECIINKAPQGLSKMPVFIRLPGKHILQIEELIKKIENEAVNKEEEYKLISKHYISTLIILLLRCASNANIGNKKPEKDITHEIISYLENNYKNVLLNDVAKHFNYNAAYFSRYFKNHIGLTFSKYINDKKIKEAINLIIHTDDPIETICYQVGFNDKKQFYNLFKKYTEMTPSEMRKLKSENKLEDTTKHLFIYHGDDFKDN